MKALLTALALALTAISIVPTLATHAPRADSLVVAEGTDSKKLRKKSSPQQCIIRCTKSCASATDETACVDACICQSCSTKKNRKCGPV